MPIFISYSHADKAFVNKLAAHLVKANAHVWVDSWELNVGDSLIGRIQQAIQESSALLVVLSKASVASEWCKKELNAGLMRELDEKRVLVLPVLIQDCEIPMFLREKLYADFRDNFDVGVKAIVDAVAKVTNLDQGRIQVGKGNIDWSDTWGFQGTMLRMDYTLIESSPDFPFTLLTEIELRGNEEATIEYLETITERMLALLKEEHRIDVILRDQHPAIKEYRLVERAGDASYDILIRCRRLGEDNGKDQLVHVTNYVNEISEHVKHTARELTKEEKAIIQKIKANR
jgi:hypothetical protein